MKHDGRVCTQPNRADFLTDNGWRFWPADGSFTKDGLDGRFQTDAAFAKEIAGSAVCPICEELDRQQTSS